MRKRILVLTILMSIGLAGCRKEKQSYDERLNWPDWWKSTLTTQRADAPGPGQQQTASSFNIWIIDAAGDPEILDQIWKPLNEVSSTDVQELRRLSLNGLRCAKGRLSDWPAVKEQLDRCQTRNHTQVPIQKTVGLFSPTALLSTPMEPKRTLFCYDRQGKLEGEDFGYSQLQLTLMFAGHIGNDRVRAVFSPKIVREVNRFEDMIPTPKRQTIEQELKQLSLVVDLAPDEFALIGPSTGKRGRLVVGSQLFESWEQGQEHTYLVVVKPVAFGPGT